MNLAARFLPKFGICKIHSKLYVQKSSENCFIYQIDRFAEDFYHFWTCRFELPKTIRDNPSIWIYLFHAIFHLVYAPRSPLDCAVIHRKCWGRWLLHLFQAVWIINMIVGNQKRQYNSFLFVFSFIVCTFRSNTLDIKFQIVAKSWFTKCEIVQKINKNFQNVLWLCFVAS